MTVDPLRRNLLEAQRMAAQLQPTRRLSVADLVDPWYERQDLESDGEWLAFVTYRDLQGVRTLRRAAEELGVSERAIGFSAQRMLWFERVRAWDSEVDRTRRSAYLARTREMSERHADQAQNMAAALMLPFAALAQAMQAKGQAGILGLLSQVESTEDLRELLRLCRQVSIPLVNVQRAERAALAGDKDDVGADDAARRDPIAERIAADPEAVIASHRMLELLAANDRHGNVRDVPPEDVTVVEESLAELAEASKAAGDSVDDEDLDRELGS